MVYYSVLAISPSSEDWIPSYVEAVGDLVARHGGKYLARTSSHEHLEGGGDGPDLSVILEWPSREAALAFMKDPDYAPHLRARTEGSTSHHLLIAGKDDLA